MPTPFFNTKKMELHKYWSVSEQGLKDLQALSDTELKKVIASKNLFAGMPTKLAEKQNKAIYGKINNTRAKKETGSANTSKDKKGNRKDSKRNA